MTATSSAHDFLPARMSLTSLRRAAETCRGCELYKHATQTVFGEGLRRARVMLIGEQPGDEEDRAGEPFVGPAGTLLRSCTQEGGLDVDDIYLTNAVKHFRWEPRGKRRLHKKPSSRQIEACKPWWQAEILVVRPEVIICLGATAAQAVIDRGFRITRERGRPVESALAPLVMATYHPSAVLRAPEAEDRRRMRRELVADLKRAADWVLRASSASARRPR